MALRSPDLVDAIGTEHDGQTVVLSLFDAEDWQDPQDHLVALQAKLNSYFGFVESGQILEDYPGVDGRALRIDLISRYPVPDDLAADFLRKAADVASQLGVAFTQKTIAS